jgi:cellulose synthase/poly-beta-1,6-N-acetylglucosamine synthase-like glycosyltransferase
LRSFLVLVPAHNEEMLISELIRSVRAAAYPQELIDLHVIADNCEDRTAEIARQKGVRVCQRQDPRNPGKGQALSWMLRRVDLELYDAVVFFDADNRVDRNFFAAANARLDLGVLCVQGQYGIANPNDSPFTRLLAVTYTLKNLLYNAGRDSLGLTVSLMGTGMVFDSSMLGEVGWEAGSIAEDLEQTLLLAERGIFVGFERGAVVRAQESRGFGQAKSQRQRWASGRSALQWRACLLILRGLRSKSLRQVDLGLDLLFPSYSKVLYLTVLASFLGALLQTETPLLLPIGIGLLGYQVFEFAIGLSLIRPNPAYFAALALAPVFLAWKFSIDLAAAAGRGPKLAGCGKTPCGACNPMVHAW